MSSLLLYVIDLSFLLYFLHFYTPPLSWLERLSVSYSCLINMNV